MVAPVVGVSGAASRAAVTGAVVTGAVVPQAVAPVVVAKAEPVEVMDVL